MGAPRFDGTAVDFTQWGTGNPDNGGGDPLLPCEEACVQYGDIVDDEGDGISFGGIRAPCIVLRACHCLPVEFSLDVKQSGLPLKWFVIGSSPRPPR